LALNPKTPQALQAEQVRKIITKRYSLEVQALRTIASIEHKMFRKNKPDYSDPESIKTTLEKQLQMFSKRRSFKHYQKKAALYLEHKPDQEKTVHKVNALLKEAYIKAQPVKHSISLSFVQE